MAGKENQSKPSKRLKRTVEDSSDVDEAPTKKAKVAAKPLEEQKTTPSKAASPLKRDDAQNGEVPDTSEFMTKAAAKPASKVEQTLAVPSADAKTALQSGASSKQSKGNTGNEPRKEVVLPLKDYANLKPLNDLAFCPFKDSPHHENQRMPLSFVVKALQLIEQQEGKNSRTVVVEIITNIFRSALLNFPEELADLLYFFIVKLAPDFAAMETGVGHEVSVKAISKCCGKTPKEIRELYKEEGDLGQVVQRSKGT